MTASSIGEETTMATGYDETGTSKTHLWMALRALSTTSFGLARRRCDRRILDIRLARSRISRRKRYAEDPRRHRRRLVACGQRRARNPHEEGHRERGTARGRGTARSPPRSRLAAQRPPRHPGRHQRPGGSVAAVARFLADTSALARLRHPAVDV